MMMVSTLLNIAVYDDLVPRWTHNHQTVDNFKKPSITKVILSQDSAHCRWLNSCKIASN